MKRIGIFGVAVLLAGPVSADQWVNGYTRNDGTYVQPHIRSSPNSYRFDNYSAQGNTNPYTGDRGSQRHEFTNPPAYNRGDRGCSGPGCTGSGWFD